MKNLIIIGLFLSFILSSALQGQTKLLDRSTILISDGTTPYPYEVSATRTPANRFDIEVRYLGGGTSQSFTLSSLNLNNFTTRFLAAVKAIGSPTTIIDAANDSNVRLSANALYHSIVFQNSLDPTPVKGSKAGKFVIQQKIPVYATVYKNSASISERILKEEKGVEGIVESDNTLDDIRSSVEQSTFIRITEGDFTVKRVEIVIHNGFINEINVTVEIDGQERIFSNPIPIGISSIQNINTFNKYYLRYRNPLIIKANSNPKRYIDYVINLRDVLDYIPEPARNVFDRSPKNKTHTIVISQNETTHIVYKEPVSQLIEAAVFSDFMGIEEDKPNGLIQTSLYRRMNLNTIRNQFLGSKDINWGIFQYLRPEVTISKVEDKERVLPLDYLTTNINGREEIHAYASSIDLHLYQYMRAGSLFNLALFQYPHFHTTVEFNTGFYFGLVPLEDSLRLNPVRLPKNNEYTAVTFETFLEGNIKFSMDKYFGFSMSYTPFVLLGLGKYYNQVKDRDKFVDNLEQGGFWDRSFLGKAELLVWVKPAPEKSNGRFFGRYRFIHQLSNPNLYYHQIQVGYSFYLEIPRPKS